MKLAMVASPPDRDNLILLAQLGIAYAVHYDMNDTGKPVDELIALQSHYSTAGLRWVVAESGPPIGRIILRLDGWEAQTEAYKRGLQALGRAGVEVIAYNFMPQLGYDAMVVRTTYDRETRGGARTSAFALADLPRDNPLFAREQIGKERLWQHLEDFLKAVIPAAEDASIRMAMHPDDPPIFAQMGADRIMSSIADFDRLLSISDSPANGITLCMGCFTEMSCDPLEVIERFRGRYPFMHIRNIKGAVDDFEERFIDDGDIDYVAVFRRLHELGFDGYLRSDHTPVLITEHSRVQEGYGMQGHIHAVGYIQALIAATKPLPAHQKTAALAL
jgi:mannonate dehydratase